MVVSDKLKIYALHHGSVMVSEGGSSGFLVAPDGSRRSITVATHPTAVAPSNDLINIPSLNGTNPVGMLNTATATLYRPLAPPNTHCLLDDQWDPSGTLWESSCAAGQPGVVWTSNLGRTWSTHHTGTLPILGLAVAPSRTAVLLGTGQPGRRYVLGGLDITTDEGRTWRHVAIPPSATVPALPPTVLEPYSIATTTQGQLFLGNGATLWEASQEWTTFQPVRGNQLSAVDVTTGDQVICANGGYLVFISTDNGTTWHSLIPRPRL